VAFFHRSRHTLASWLIRGLALPSHPFLARRDPDLAAAFLGGCEAWARRLGCARLTLNSFMSGDSPLLPSTHGHVESLRMELVADLRADADTLWRNLRKDQRERVRRLGREGVVVGQGTTLEDFQDLFTVRDATRRKRWERGQALDVQDSPVFYEGLYRHLAERGAGRLFVARRQGEVVAALFFTTFNRAAYSVFSGSTDEGYRSGAQTGLYWAAVETLKAEGFVELNRGGVPASAQDEADPLHGIYQFKLRLGTTPVLCRSGSKVLSPVREGLARLGRRLHRVAAGA
jgi:hypothetical protein